MNIKNLTKEGRQVLIIGDIAGRFNELMSLLKIATEKHEVQSIVAVGDLVDRGPDSNKVVDFFMNTSDTYVVKGNHEDMMVDYIDSVNEGVRSKYAEEFGWEVWLGNGGNETLKSYGHDGVPDVPKGHVDFLANLPLYIEHETDEGKILITHAPISSRISFDELKTTDTAEDYSLCWNRESAMRIEGVNMQFHGHNAVKSHVFFNDDLGPYAVNIDTSRGNKLTGILWPSMEVFQVPNEE